MGRHIIDRLSDPKYIKKCTVLDIRLNLLVLHSDPKTNIANDIITIKAVYHASYLVISPVDKHF